MFLGGKQARLLYTLPCSQSQTDYSICNAIPVDFLWNEELLYTVSKPRVVEPERLLLVSVRRLANCQGTAMQRG